MIDDTEQRLCIKCMQRKSVDEFSSPGTRRCNDCMAEYHREYNRWYKDLRRGHRTETYDSVNRMPPGPSVPVCTEPDCWAPQKSDGFCRRHLGASNGG